jgi:hypothetical protein
MVTTGEYVAPSSTKDYEKLIGTLYGKARETVAELLVPRIKVIAVEGNEPPGSEQFQAGIAALYGVAYTLKMGLKFQKLPRPEGYFDYKVGALEALWWSEPGTTFEINNPKTLRWKIYLMVPDFISEELVALAADQAREKHPETDYSRAKLETLEEGASVQALNLGPYDKEEQTIEKLHAYIREHGLTEVGPHHEIYVSDPNRTAPEKLKTVIRYPVKA